MRIYPVIERSHILDDFDNGATRADVLLDMMRTADKAKIVGKTHIPTDPGRIVSDVKLQAVLLDDKTA